MALEPITRQEKIIAGQDLTPITRMEKFLKQYGGGGSGGGSTDAVLYTEQTLTDAQKKRARENIDAASDFVVNGTINEEYALTLDKTFAQISEAIGAGKIPVLVVLGNYFQVSSSNEQYIMFGAMFGDKGGSGLTSVYVYPDADPSLSQYQLLNVNSNGTIPQSSMASGPTNDMQIATKKYVDDKECILKSTTPGSTKKFKITVDDSGAISATEVT